jgi:hypothetical protein
MKTYRKGGEGNLKKEEKISLPPALTCPRRSMAFAPQLVSEHRRLALV